MRCILSITYRRFVRVCVCVFVCVRLCVFVCGCVCVCSVCLVGGPREKSTIFTILEVIKKPSNDKLIDVVAHDINVLMKVKDWIRDPFSTLKVVISQTVTDRGNVTIAIT